MGDLFSLRKSLRTQGDACYQHAAAVFVQQVPLFRQVQHGFQILILDAGGCGKGLWQYAYGAGILL